MEKYEERMTIDEERKYLHKMRIRYWKAKSRKERSKYLDEMQEVTGKHRKSLIRLINGDLARKRRRRERGPTYGTEVVDAVKKIAYCLDFPCAERLQPILVRTGKQLIYHGELSISKDTLEKLGRVSISTVRRMIGPVTHIPQRISAVRKPNRRKQTYLRTIPTKRIAWDEQEIGHWEVDTVHHCGVSASGQYVHTLQATEVVTGWVECAAVLGRSYRVIHAGFERIQARALPPFREIHPDNGSEFFNAHLLRFWGEQFSDAQISRSRPYQKNDNRFVEENNASLVRAYVGYQRLDTIAQTLLLNKFYTKLCLYHNFFQPCMRQIEKIYPTNSGTRSIRKHDIARTPFDRYLASGLLSPIEKARLSAMRMHINPMQLREEIEETLTQLAQLPMAKEGVVEDVHETLLCDVDKWTITSPSSPYYDEIDLTVR